ncbi:MAG: STAS domain-containing protein [Burkholderiales bacterium]
MTIYAENKEGRSILHVDGEMTIYQAADIKNELMGHLASSEGVDIDLSAVSELDSAGLQLLILAKREATQTGKSLRLLSHSQAVLDVLDICNLAAYFGDPVVMSPSAHH